MAFMVFSVPLACWDAVLPKALSMVLSTARAQNGSVPHTSWTRLIPSLSNGGEVSGASVNWTGAPMISPITLRQVSLLISTARVAKWPPLCVIWQNCQRKIATQWPNISRLYQPPSRLLYHESS